MRRGAQHRQATDTDQAVHIRAIDAQDLRDLAHGEQLRIGREHSVDGTTPTVHKHTRRAPFYTMCVGNGARAGPKRP